MATKKRVEPINLNIVCPFTGGYDIAEAKHDQFMAKVNT